MFITIFSLPCFAETTPKWYLGPTGSVTHWQALAILTSAFAPFWPRVPGLAYSKTCPRRLALLSVAYITYLRNDCSVVPAKDGRRSVQTIPTRTSPASPSLRGGPSADEGIAGSTDVCIAVCRDGGRRERAGVGCSAPRSFLVLLFFPSNTVKDTPSSQNAPPCR